MVYSGLHCRQSQSRGLMDILHWPPEPERRWSLDLRLRGSVSRRWCRVLQDANVFRRDLVFGLYLQATFAAGSTEIS